MWPCSALIHAALMYTCWHQGHTVHVLANKPLLGLLEFIEEDSTSLLHSVTCLLAGFHELAAHRPHWTHSRHSSFPNKMFSKEMSTIDLKGKHVNRSKNTHHLR